MNRDDSDAIARRRPTRDRMRDLEMDQDCVEREWIYEWEWIYGCEMV